MRYVTIVIRRLSGVVASGAVRQVDFGYRSDFEAVQVGGMLAQAFSPDEEDLDGIVSIALRDDEVEELRREDTHVWILAGTVEECPALDRLADKVVEWMGWVNDPYVAA